MSAPFSAKDMEVLRRMRALIEAGRAHAREAKAAYQGVPATAGRRAWSSADRYAIRYAATAPNSPLAAAEARFLDAARAACGEDAVLNAAAALLNAGPADVMDKLRPPLGRHMARCRRILSRRIAAQPTAALLDLARRLDRLASLAQPSGPDPVLAVDAAAMARRLVALRPGEDEAL